MTHPLPVVDGIDPTASIMRRIIAWFVDSLLLSAVSAFAVWLVPVTFVEHTPAPGVTYFEPEGSASAIAFLYLLPILFWFGNYVVLQGLKGYTLGKFVLSLRTVRFDGRPAGLGRAFVRSIVLTLGMFVGGCFYLVFALLMVIFTKGHRRAGDFLAGTFVIDALYEGHIITLTANGATAGPRSLYASEVSEVAVPGDGDRAQIEAQLRPNDPVFDKKRNTYVVWNAQQDRLLVFDKPSKTWKPTA